MRECDKIIKLENGEGKNKKKKQKKKFELCVFRSVPSDGELAGCVREFDLDSDDKFSEHEFVTSTHTLNHILPIINNLFWWAF